MSKRIAALMDHLQEDPWRLDNPFSPEVQQVLDKVVDPATSEESTIATLNGWLAKYQPCLFGRIAAKNELISYCLLTQEDLFETDERIRDKIQEARRTWTRRGFEGNASGFIVALLSQQLAMAIPDEVVKDLALRVCSLYLREEIEPDMICLDRIYLEQPGNRRTTWEWVTGVNYFSAQGDTRWWQDHRMPAGMAFSVNSVGHMVKAGKLAKAVHDLEEVMETAPEEFSNPKVDSLEKALELAMRTIDLASNAISGKATMLLPLPDDTSDLPKCPISLPPPLAGKSHCEYLGLYHTDFTVPSEYFLPDVQRPSSARTHNLDFTYLFDSLLDNPDYDVIGKGRLIREPSALEERLHLLAAYRREKRLRGAETEVEIANSPMLREALGL